jgi:glycosyltransferase involved in cell wall biosynthesis
MARNPVRQGSTQATRLYINVLFQAQRTTGQQRYASEVTRRLIDRPDVLPLSAPPSWGSVPTLTHLWAQVGLPFTAADGVLLSMTARSPVAARRHVVVVHDLFPITNPEWYSRTYAVTHAAALHVQLRTASVLAAVSEPVQEQLRERYPDKEVVLAPNAPADCFGRTVGPAASAPPPSRQGFILAVGSADPRKNFARLLTAYERLSPDLRQAHPLVIVGGEGSQFAASGVHLQTESTIRRLGYVDDNELAQLYAAAAVVVVPSLNEGFGLPVVEALAAGAQVVASDIPAFRWVAGRSATYFNPLSDVSIAEAMADALLRPTPPDRRLQDREIILERFSWEKTAQLLLEAASSLM